MQSVSTIISNFLVIDKATPIPGNWGESGVKAVILSPKDTDSVLINRS